ASGRRCAACAKPCRDRRLRGTARGAQPAIVRRRRPIPARASTPRAQAGGPPAVRQLQLPSSSNGLPGSAEELPLPELPGPPEVGSPEVGPPVGGSPVIVSGSPSMVTVIVSL